jgi:hypothetical protein
MILRGFSRQQWWIMVACSDPVISIPAEADPERSHCPSAELLPAPRGHERAIFFSDGDVPNERVASSKFMDRIYIYTWNPNDPCFQGF